jgi:hypothetical protein
VQGIQQGAFPGTASRLKVACKRCCSRSKTRVKRCGVGLRVEPPFAQRSSEVLDFSHRLHGHFPHPTLDLPCKELAHRCLLSAPTDRQLDLESRGWGSTVAPRAGRMALASRTFIHGPFTTGATHGAAGKCLNTDKWASHGAIEAPLRASKTAN